MNLTKIKKLFFFNLMTIMKNQIINFFESSFFANLFNNYFNFDVSWEHEVSVLIYMCIQNTQL